MPLLDEWYKLKNKLESQDALIIERLVTAYGLTYERITPQINALIEYLTAQLESGKLTKADVRNSAAFSNLIRSITSELDAYQGYLQTEIRNEADKALRSGLTDGQTLLLIAISGALLARLSDLPRETVIVPSLSTNFLEGLLDRLELKINTLSNFHADEITQGILDMVGKGVNPVDIAKWITDAYGVGLTDSIRMMRTAQLYAYRMANAEVQKANADLLNGVVWCATLDNLTCMSCTALHGQVFPVGTICNDHYNGRCVMLPWVKGEPNPVAQSGADWYNAQSEGTQKAMMGASKWDAWMDGKFDFSNLTRSYDDPVYGEMLGEASLKSLLDK